MAEKTLNIRFVKLVEKHPELYDYTFKDYAKKNVTNKAWCEVATKVKLTVNECKAKWKDLLSAYISDMGPPSNGPGRRKINRYYYMTGAMQFMFPLIRTPGMPVESSSDRVQRPESGTTQCRPGSTQNALNMVKKKKDCRPASGTAVESSFPYSVDQQLVATTRRQEDDFSRGKTPDRVSEFCSTTGRETSQKRTRTDVHGLSADQSNARNEETTPSKCNHEKTMFLLSLLPKLERMTCSQMSLFERGILQIIDDIINPRTYLQLLLPSDFTPTSSFMSSSQSSAAMDQYIPVAQHSSESQYPSVGQCPLGLPTHYQMPAGQQQHNSYGTFSPQGILSQNLGTFSPQTTFLRSSGTNSPRNVFPQSLEAICPQIMNYFSSDSENFHTGTL